MVTGSLVGWTCTQPQKGNVPGGREIMGDRQRKAGSGAGTTTTGWMPGSESGRARLQCVHACMPSCSHAPRARSSAPQCPLSSSRCVSKLHGMGQRSIWEMVTT